MTASRFRVVLEVASYVLGVLLVMLLVALTVPPFMGTVFMLVAAAALIPSPIAYHWVSRGRWHRHPVGWHLMAYMGVFAAVMVLAVSGTVASDFAIPQSELPDWCRPLVWEAVAFVAWWRLLVILHTPRTAK